MAINSTYISNRSVVLHTHNNSKPARRYQAATKSTATKTTTATRTNPTHFSRCRVFLAYTMRELTERTKFFHIISCVVALPYAAVREKKKLVIYTFCLWKCWKMATTNISEATKLYGGNLGLMWHIIIIIAQWETIKIQVEYGMIVPMFCRRCACAELVWIISE